MLGLVLAYSLPPIPSAPVGAGGLRRKSRPCSLNKCTTMLPCSKVRFARTPLSVFISQHPKIRTPPRSSKVPCSIVDPKPYGDLADPPPANPMPMKRRGKAVPAVPRAAQPAFGLLGVKVLTSALQPCVTCASARCVMTRGGLSQTPPCSEPAGSGVWRLCSEFLTLRVRRQ